MCCVKYVCKNSCMWTWLVAIYRFYMPGYGCRISKWSLSYQNDLLDVRLWCVFFFFFRKIAGYFFSKTLYSNPFFFSRCHCECHWLCCNNKYLAGKKPATSQIWHETSKVFIEAINKSAEMKKRIGCRQKYECAWKINVELSEVTTVINRFRIVCFSFFLSFSRSDSTLDGYLITWPRCTNKAASIIPASDYMVE